MCRALGRDFQCQDLDSMLDNCNKLISRGEIGV